MRTAEKRTAGWDRPNANNKTKRLNLNALACRCHGRLALCSTCRLWRLVRDEIQLRRCVA